MLAWPTVPAVGAAARGAAGRAALGHRDRRPGERPRRRPRQPDRHPGDQRPGRAQLRRAADRPAAAGGLGPRRAPARRRRGARAGQRAPLGRGAAAARRVEPCRRGLRCQATGRRRDRRAGPARQTGSRASAARPHFAYTRPSPARYPWQWYWDSCFAAIVWRRFDPDRARAELESLLAAQREDGFIGHTIFWDRPVSLGRLPFYNVASRSSFQTETIQPPLLAWAWRIAVGDPAAEPRIAAQVDWLARQPRPRGRRAALDRPARRVRPRRLAQVRPGLGPAGERPDRLPLPRPPQPPARLRRLAGSASAGGPVLCEVLVNTFWSLSLQALGRPSATPALVDRLWDERRGLFLDEAQPGGGRPRTVTWASLAPLALPDLPEEIGRRLVEEHLLSAREFPTPVAPPSVAVERAQLRARRAAAGRSAATGAGRPGSTPPGWSGSGCAGSATSRRPSGLAQGLFGAVEREGLREYYDPRDGTGLGAESTSPGRR